MVAALVICLLITAGLDVVAGRTLAAGEAIYVLEVAGLGLLWRLATPIGGAAASTSPLRGMGTIGQGPTTTRTTPSLCSRVRFLEVVMAMLDRDHQQAGVEVPAPHRPIQRPPPGSGAGSMGRAVVSCRSP